MRVVRAQKVIAAGLLFLLSAFAAAAQDVPCLHRNVAVSVLDKSAKPVTGLGPQDFRAEFKGKELPILSAKIDSGMHRVVVMLDSSRSMFEGEQLWPSARAFAKEILSIAPGRFRAGLIVFNDRVRVKIPVQDDPAAARRAVEDLPTRVDKKDERTGRKTAVLDALMAGADLLEPPQFGDSIYLITDGGENDSNTSGEAVRSALQLRGIRLYLQLLIVNRWGVQMTVEQVTGPPQLLELVNDSGGLIGRVELARYPVARLGSADPEESQRARWAAEGFYAAIQVPYRLEVALPGPVQKPEKWRISVPNAKARKLDLAIGYPARLAGCSSSAPDKH